MNRAVMRPTTRTNADRDSDPGATDPSHDGARAPRARDRAQTPPPPARPRASGATLSCAAAAHAAARAAASAAARAGHIETCRHRPDSSAVPPLPSSTISCPPSAPNARARRRPARRWPRGRGQVRAAAHPGLRALDGGHRAGGPQADSESLMTRMNCSYCGAVTRAGPNLAMAIRRRLALPDHWQDPSATVTLSS